MKRVLAALLVAMLAVPASATLYKWTDATGRVVYSDLPPTGDMKVEIVNGPAPPANPNAVKEMAGKEAELKKRQTDAAEKEKKAEEQRVQVAKRNEECQRVQLQVKQLGAGQVALVRYNEKGEIVYVDDATRRKERAEGEAWIKANCGSEAK